MPTEGEVWRDPETGDEVEILETGKAGAKLDPDNPTTPAVRVRRTDGRQAVFKASEFVKRWERQDG